MNYPAKYRTHEVDGDWFAQRKLLGLWISIPGPRVFPSQREAQTHLNTHIRAAKQKIRK